MGMIIKNPEKELTTAVLILPSYLDSCSSFVIDLSLSSGNGGREWAKVEYDVVSLGNTSHGAVLNNYLSQLPLSERLIVNVNSGLISADVYIITATLANFFNLVDTTNRMITVVADTRLPVLSILSPSVMVIKASSPLVILTRASGSPCSQSSYFNYLWMVSNSSGYRFRSSSVDPSRFVLPPFSLRAGTNYSVM